MDFNDSLIWLVALCALLLAVRVAGQRPFPWGWAVVLCGVGGTLAVAAATAPSIAGYIGLAAWLLFVLVPAAAQRTALRLIHSRRTHAARRMAALATWLHPADGWRETRRFVNALAALQEGRPDEGRRLLGELRSTGSSLGRTALAILARQSGDWSQFLAWIDASPDRESLLADGNVLDVYLQALGETGQRLRMVHEFGHRLDGHPHPAAQLRVAALCGDAATVEHLLNGPLHGWPSEVADFWRATAQQASGDPSSERVFARLVETDNPLVRELARRRIEQPLPRVSPEALDAAAKAILDDLRRDAAHESQFAVMSSTPYRRAVATQAIALVLAINFARELPGGSTNQQNLIELGAIVIPRRPPWYAPWLPSYDEWWRPLTAAFLHFGWAHFLMNLFGLLYLGARLERAWGPWRTLLCYVAAIGVSMSVTPWLLERTATEPQILAGASGGIMGLMGGLLGHLIVGRVRRRTPQVARQLSLLVGFALLQTAFDFSHEEVSYQAHLLGLATGCIVGLLFGAFSPTAAMRDGQDSDIEAEGLRG